MNGKIYCYECKKDIEFDWDYDVFRLRLCWENDFDHCKGFVCRDLGYSAVICPTCGREYQVDDQGDSNGYGPYGTNNVIKEMGDQVFLLREYHEAVQRYGENDPRISLILS